jgi:hypothetical protein
VYGNWHHDALTKEMKKVHFPVLRVTIESVIRLLVNEFGVETNTDEAIWRPMLAATEQEFLSIARTQRTTESAPH